METTEIEEVKKFNAWQERLKPDVRVISPWESYKRWKAGEIFLPDLLYTFLESLRGRVITTFLWRGKQAAEKIIELEEPQLKRLLGEVCLVGETHTEACAFVETFIEPFRPIVEVSLLHQHHWGKWLYRYCTVGTNKTAHTHIIYTETQERLGKKREPIWNIARLRDEQRYWRHKTPLGRVEIPLLASELTYQQALEQARTLAYNAA